MTIIIDNNSEIEYIALLGWDGSTECHARNADEFLS